MTSAFDELGRVAETSCFDERGLPKKSAGAGAETVRIEREGSTRVTMYYLDGAGKPVANADQGWGGGSHKAVTLLDAMGNVLRQEYYDVAGRPMRTALGFFAAEARRDSVGRLREERYFDGAGRPALRANRVDPSEDLKDLFGEYRLFVLAGVLPPERLSMVGQGGFHRIVQEFDPRGNVAKRSFYGRAGEPVAGLNGLAEERVAYDVFDRPVLFTPVTAGQPARVSARIEYNANGQPTRVMFVDRQGRPINGLQGYSGFRIFYKPDLAFDRAEPFRAES